MVFFGINQNKLELIAAKLGLVMENVRPQGRGIALKLTPPNSDHKYARTSGQGRRLKACSYEAFRDFTLSAFANGATAVNTVHPQLRKNVRMDESTFRCLLGYFAGMNVGSQVCPAYMSRLSNEAVETTVVIV